MPSTPNAARTVAQLEPGDHVAIIGGGPAGLTAAYLLTKDGVDVTVLEGDEELVGGISRTVVYNGYRYDIGGHRFFTKIRPVEELWEEILGDEFIDVPRLSRIHYRGKFFDYPLRARNALSGLGIFNSIAIVLSYMKAQIWPEKEEKNFEQWVSQPLRQAALQHLLQDLHREGLGHALLGDQRRVGGAAHPEPVAGPGDPERRLAQQALEEDQEPQSTPSGTRGSARARCGKCVATRSATRVAAS